MFGKLLANDERCVPPAPSSSDTWPGVEMNWFPTGFTRKSGSTGKKRNWIHHLPKSFSLAPGPNRSMSAERDIFFRAWTVLFERESVWPARTFYCSRRRKVDQGQELKLKKSRVDHGAPWRTMPARGVPFLFLAGSGRTMADQGSPEWMAAGSGRTRAARRKHTHQINVLCQGTNGHSNTSGYPSALL